MQYKKGPGGTYQRTVEVREVLDYDLLQDRITTYMRQKECTLIFIEIKELTKPSPHLETETLDSAFPIDCNETKFQCAMGPDTTETNWIASGLMTLKQIIKRLRICKDFTSQKLLLNIGTTVTKEDGTSYNISTAEETKFKELARSEEVRLEFIRWI